MVRGAAAKKAAHTARWATTMTKWLVSFTKSRTAWQVVEFTGPHGRESRGIVDLLAVRKNHRQPVDGLKRGDLLEIVLLQVKGGTARWPSWDDIDRLRRVARHHRAKAVVLAVWHKGAQPTLYGLKSRVRHTEGPRSAWDAVTPEEVFR